VRPGDLVKYKGAKWCFPHLYGKIGIIEGWYCITRGYVYVCWSTIETDTMPVQEKYLEVINETE